MSKTTNMERFGVWLQFDKGEDGVEEDFYWNTRVGEFKGLTMTEATKMLEIHQQKFPCTLLQDKKAANVEEREKSFAAIAVMVGDNVGTLKQFYKKMTDTKRITEDSVKTVLCPSRRIVKVPEKMLISESTEAEDSQKLLVAKRKKNDLNLQKRKIAADQSLFFKDRQNQIEKKAKQYDVSDDEDRAESIIDENEVADDVMPSTNGTPDHETPHLPSPKKTSCDSHDYLLERDVARQERDQLQQQVYNLQRTIQQNDDFIFKLKKIEDISKDIDRKLEFTNTTLSFLKNHLITQQCETLLKDVENQAFASVASQLDTSYDDQMSPADPNVEAVGYQLPQVPGITTAEEKQESKTSRKQKVVLLSDESDSTDVQVESLPTSNTQITNSRKKQPATQNGGDVRLETQRLYRDSDAIFQDGKETPVALSDKVCVPKSVLDNLVRHSTKSQGCFGLNLIRGLVKPEYLINNTLYGSSRGRKGGSAAPGIAPEIVDAVFKYIPIARNRILKTHALQQTRARRPGEKIITAGMFEQWKSLDEAKIKSAINKGLGKCVADTNNPRVEDAKEDDSDDSSPF